MPDTPAVDDTAPSIPFEKITLANGLNLILHVDRKLPVVHVNQWYHVGSKNEKRGRTGFAHLFEHIMFEGSLNAKPDYFSYVERAGANLREGGVNGTTDFDRTNYFATVPSANLELLLWVESDRLATLAEALTQEKLDNQRDVVRNERRQSYENQPYGRAFMIVTQNLHPPDHPYSWDVIGSHEDLVAASLDDVRDFFHRFYSPNNLSLAIAGDFDRDEVLRLVEKYFGSIATGPALERMSRYIPRLNGPKTFDVQDRVPQERVYVAFPAPAYFGAGAAELDLGSLILSDGLASRLARRLVYDERLCSDVSSSNQGFEISGAFFVVATARPGADLSAIEGVIADEIRRAARGGVTDVELARAKTKWEYGFVTGLERIGGFGGKADVLNMYNTFLGDPGLIHEDVRRYRSATTESVSSAIGKWLDTDSRLSVRFHPEISERSPVVIDRSVQPALGSDHHFAPPEVRTARLANGLEVMVVERSDLPKVAVSLVTHAGSVFDDAPLSGTASLMASTIASGTTTRDALEIENALGDLGTAIDSSAGRETTMLSFDVLRRHLDATLAIVSDVVRNATFPAEDVDRERARHLDALAQQSNHPSAIASRLRSMLLFGREHPYGRPSSGLPATVERITREDLAAFHSRYWAPGASALVFTGAITLEDAVRSAEAALGDWVATAAAHPAIPAPSQPEWGRVYLVDRPDAAQTVVSQILLGPPRTAGDFYEFRLLDAIWGGGGFGTRLNLNLREDKGYTYGMFSSIAAYSTLGIWWASGAVQTDKTVESVRELITELEGLGGKRPITEDEVEFARSSRVRGYAQQFESLSRIAGQVASLWGQRLPMSEMQNEATRTARARLEDIARAAGRYVNPRHSILLLVGDLSKIEQGIRELGVGEVSVVDAEGREVSR